MRGKQCGRACPPDPRVYFPIHRHEQLAVRRIHDGGFAIVAGGEQAVRCGVKREAVWCDGRADVKYGKPRLRILK